MFKKIILSTVSASMLAGPASLYAQDGSYQIRVPVQTVAFVPTSQVFDFGKVLKGQAPQRTFTFTNQSSDAVTIGDFSSEGPMRVVSTTCEGSIATAESCQVVAELRVDTVGVTTGMLRLGHSGASVADEFILRATGVKSEGILSANPAFLDFGNTELRAPVGPRTIQITNTGTGPIDIYDLSMGENANNFTVQNLDCYYLEPSDSCSVRVTFTARTTGRTQARLMAEVDTGDTVQVASVAGNVAIGIPAWTATDLTFRDIPVSQKSEAQTATLTNTGSGALVISRIRVSGDSSFVVESHTCGTTLPPKSSCTVHVTAQPRDSLSRSGILIAELSNSSASSVSAQMLLMPVSAQAKLTVTPSLVDFGEAGVGTSVVRDFVLTSTGDLPVNVTDFVLSGPNSSSFQILNAGSCTGELAPTATCTVSVRATPSALRTEQATIQVQSDAASPASPVSLRVTGINGTLTVNPISLVFDAIEQGQQATLTAEVENNSTVPVQLTGIGSLGNTQTNFSYTGCPTGSIVPGARCTITVTYKPTAIGAHTGTYLINNTGSTPSLRLNVSGSSIQPKAAAGVLTPFTCNTPATAGQTVTCTATLTSTGELPLPVNSVTRSGTAFNNPTHTCGVSLAVGASCTITVTGSFNTAGTFSTTVTVGTGTSSLTSNASVTIIAPRVELQTFPHASTTAGVANFETHLLTNYSNVPVTLTFPGTTTTSTKPAGSAAAAGFAYVTNTCASPLAAGASCAITTRFSPDRAGAYAGSLAIPVSSGSWTSTVTGPLSGTATAPPDATMWLEANPNPVNWGLVTVTAAQPSPPTNRTVTIYNRASSTTATGLQFSVEGLNSSEVRVLSTTCGASLAAGANCTVTLQWTPAAAPGSERRATLLVNSSLPELVVPLTLSVSGGMLSTTDVDFGEVQVGSSKTLQVVFTNTGNAPVSRPTAVTVTPTGVFTAVMVGTCAVNLPVNVSCTYNVTFKPTAVGPVSGSLTQAHAGYANPTSAKLTGTGTPAPAPKVTISEFVCTPGTIGPLAQARCVATITSSGAAPLTVNSAVRVGPTGWSTVTLTGCTANLAVGSSCTATMTLTATAAMAGTTTSADVTFTTTGGVEVRTAQVPVLKPTLQLSENSHGTLQTRDYRDIQYTLTNTGSIDVLNLVNPSGFSAPFYNTSKTCGTTLAAGASCTITMRCAPSNLLGSFTGTLVVSGAGATAQTGLSCESVGPQLDVVPNGDLSTIVGGHSYSGNWFRLENNGLGPVTISSLASNSSTWTLTAPLKDGTQCNVGAIIPAGQSCLVQATMISGGPDITSSATFTISTNLSAKTFTSTLSTKGVSITEVTPFTTGATNVAGQAVFKVTNEAPWPLQPTGVTSTVTAFAIASNTCVGATLASGDTCTFTVNHTSATAGTFAAQFRVTGRYPQIMNNRAGSYVSQGIQGTYNVSRTVVVANLTWNIGSYVPTAAGSSSTTTSTVSNLTVVPITLTGNMGISTGQHTIVSTTCIAGKVLNQGDSCEVVTRYSPPAGTTTVASATLTVNTSIGARSGTIYGNLMPAGDIAVSVTSTAAQLPLSGTAVVTVTVSNTATSGIAEVTLTNGTSASGGASIASRTASTCTPAATTSTCVAFTDTSATLRIAARGSVTLRYNVVAGPTEGVLTSTATIQSISGVQDTNAANNTASAVSTVMAPGADLAISFSSFPAELPSGESSTISMLVRNISTVGPLTADLGKGQVSFSLSVASGTARGAAQQTTCGTVSAGATCSANGAVTIPPGGSVVLNALVAWSGTGTINATATVTPVGMKDPNMANNTATVSNRTVREIPVGKWCHFTSNRQGYWPSGATCYNGNSPCTSDNCTCEMPYNSKGWLNQPLLGPWSLGTNTRGHLNQPMLPASTAEWKWNGTDKNITFIAAQYPSGSGYYTLREFKDADRNKSGVELYYGYFPQVQVWNGSKWTDTWRNYLNGKQHYTVMGYWGGNYGNSADTGPGSAYHPAMWEDGDYSSKPPAGTVIFQGPHLGIWHFLGRTGQRIYINYKTTGQGADKQQYRQIWYEMSPGANCIVAGTTRVG